MTRAERWRRDVLENPDAYSAEERSVAWEMTARQCRLRGVEWAAEIADEEARQALSTSFRLLEVR
jgi:hypothetical protein